VRSFSQGPRYPPWLHLRTGQRVVRGGPGEWQPMTDVLIVSAGLTGLLLPDLAASITEGNQQLSEMVSLSALSDGASL